MNYKYSTLALAIVALLTGCGAEDNKDISGDNKNIYPPIIKGDVTIPALHVGYTAKGAYQYFDPNPVARPEGKSLYSWRDANETELGTEQSLTLTYEMLGENVKFCVKPVAQASNNNSTVGDEECSAPRVVQETLGEKPLADNVVLDNTAPTVGDTLTGSYDYSHSEHDEGKTLFTWYAGSSVIPGASTKTLTLLPEQTEGKAVKFCVTPATNESVPVRGDETCSEPTDAVLVKVGSAPVAENTGITGDAFVGATLTGSYDYKDDDGDKEGASTIVWKREGTEITDATANTYLAVDADEGKDLTFCVTPVSATGNPTIGVEDCSDPQHITKKNEAAPVATDVTAKVEADGIAEPGAVLVGSYTYTQSESAPEGDSVGYWEIGGVQVACDNDAQGCDYTIKQADIGKNITFSVTPYTALGTPGAKATSSQVFVNGIKLSGVLEYDKQVFAAVEGYDGYTNPRWMVNTGDQNGPVNDDAAVGDASRTEQGTGLSYKIGVRDLATDAPRQVEHPKKGPVDAGTLGIKEDYDWILEGNSPVVDARNFIGKALEFCIDVNSDKKCISAADYPEVTGGLYYSEDDETKRAIEPIRVVSVGTATYHRPLTVAETKRTDTAEFGAGLPAATQPEVINGISWALFSHDEGDKNLLNACRNLHSTAVDSQGEWHLPQGYFSGTSYIHNFYAADGNTPPTVSTESLKIVNEKLISGLNDNSYKMSPVFGWPVSDGKDKVSYATASQAKSNGKFYLIRLYSWSGANTSTAPSDMGGFVSCVK